MWIVGVSAPCFENLLDLEINLSTEHLVCIFILVSCLCRTTLYMHTFVWIRALCSVIEILPQTRQGQQVFMVSSLKAKVQSIIQRIDLSYSA